jgi:hypothetical protein
MLREAWDWITTPTDRLTRSSGHLSEFVAIAARRRRHRASWAVHEERVKRAVMEAAERCDPDGTALILGAGHLHDIPLGALSARFGHVALVDLAFSSTTRRAARRLLNVSCVRHDVTEALEALAAAQSDGDIRIPRPKALIHDARITFAASINLLSQLPIGVGRILEAHGFSEPEVERYQKAVVEAHLDWLGRFGCPRLLICDRAYEVVSGEGRVVETADPLYGASLPTADQEWVWDIAPPGEIDRNHAVRHRVVAAQL